MSSCVAVTSLDAEPIALNTDLVRVAEHRGISAPEIWRRIQRTSRFATIGVPGSAVKSGHLQPMPCVRCPLRGTCRSGLPVSEEGVLMCAADGLSGNRQRTIAPGCMARTAGSRPVRRV
jgi:hypothetical protein